MKVITETPKKFVCPTSRLLAVLAAALLLGHPSQAQLTWDADTGTIGAQDGSGTWNLSNTNWWNGSSNVSYTTSAATFGAGVAGTYVIDLDDDVGISNPLTFATDGYTISADEARKISASSATGIIADSGVTATIGNNITIEGTAGSNPAIRLSGAGTIILESGSTVRTTNPTLSQLAIGSSSSGLQTTVRVKTGALIESARLLRVETGTLSVEGGAVQTVSPSGNDGFSLGAAATYNATTNPEAVLTISSGTFSSVGGAGRDGIRIGTGSNSLNGGIINLDGGTIITTSINSVAQTTGNARGVINFNGGVLKVHEAADDAQRQAFVTGFSDNDNKRALVQAGGAKIDTNGFDDVTILSALLSGTAGDGGLTLNDTATTAGKLTLDAVNTYNGVTNVIRGTLALSANGSIDNSARVDLNAGAVFDTTAQSTFTMLSGQPFQFTIDGAGAGSAGRLGAAGLDITNGGVDFSTIGTLDDPAYIIASYTSLTGSQFASVSNSPSGYSIDYNYLGNNQIALVVPEPTTFVFLLGGFGLLGLTALRRRAR